MRFVTIQIGCDWANCDVVAPESEGLVTEMTLSVDGKPAKSFGIYKEHRDQLEENLHTLLARGATVETKKKPATRSTPAAVPSAGTTVGVGTVLTCRVPGCGRDDLNGNVGLAQHLKKKHGLTIAQHDEQYPTG